ncbi:MAG: 4Fe-4S dicluster domain-containing protein, partial [Deltaproteobacteria bacterium]|nr:4Fe-4S dicluster domain-containing protein [Deltaproteobacteria bacterium]
MTKRLLRKEKIDTLIKDVARDGFLFVAPKVAARQVVYGPVSSAEDIEFDYIIPGNSFKEFLFPQTEVVARFKIHREGVDCDGAEVKPKGLVIFGSRPCDAASLSSLRSVFAQGPADEFYTKREDRAIVVTVACTSADEACFCTTVGLSPEVTGGSDVFLKETEEGDFIAEAVTEKGRAFIGRYSGAFEDKVEGRPKEVVMPSPVPDVSIGKIKEWLKDKNHYENPVWAELARKCIGCGACTFSCPTCHCFDIVDEGAYADGERRKDWDSCQFPLFTLHASGHNPRDVQYKRWKNR